MILLNFFYKQSALKILKGFPLNSVRTHGRLFKNLEIISFKLCFRWLSIVNIGVVLYIYLIHRMAVNIHSQNINRSELDDDCVPIYFIFFSLHFIISYYNTVANAARVPSSKATFRKITFYFSNIIIELVNPADVSIFFQKRQFLSIYLQIKHIFSKLHGTKFMLLF